MEKEKPKKPEEYFRYGDLFECQGAVVMLCMVGTDTTAFINLASGNRHWDPFHAKPSPKGVKLSDIPEGQLACVTHMPGVKFAPKKQEGVNATAHDKTLSESTVVCPGDTLKVQSSENTYFLPYDQARAIRDHAYNPIAAEALALVLNLTLDQVKGLDYVLNSRIPVVTFEDLKI